MSNELYQHKRSDTIKWVLTLLAFILVGVMLAGIILGWFEKKEESPAEEEQTEQAAVIDGEGNAMDADTVYAMPEAMSFSYRGRRYWSMRPLLMLPPYSASMRETICVNHWA